MRNNLLIAGIILIIVGLTLVGFGYNKMQPSKLEKTIGFMKDLTENLTGEEIVDIPKRNETEPTLMMIFGSLSFFVGLIMVLKSGQKKHSNTRFTVSSFF